MNIRTLTTTTKTKTQVKISIDIERTEIRIWETQIGARVHLRNWEISGEVNGPGLPRKVISIALPPGTRAEAAEVRTITHTSITETSVVLAPILPLRQDVLSLDLDHRAAVVRDERLYQKAKKNPPPVARMIDTIMIGEIPIARVELNPVWARKGAGLELATKIEITLPLKAIKPSPRSEKRPRISQSQYQRQINLAKAAVINPEDIQDMGQKLRFTLNEVDFLILTDNLIWDAVTHQPIGVADGDLAAAFDRLREWRADHGLKCKVVTITDIVNNTSGYGDFVTGSRDLQQTLRRFLQWARSNWGVTYVLLGGNAQIIPPRSLRISDWLPNGLTPTDFYYSSLGSKNEWIEGAKIDYWACDYSIDLAIGRVAVGSAIQVGDFIRKVIEYEQQRDPDGNPISASYLRKLLFADTPWNWDRRIDVFSTEDYPPDDYRYYHGGGQPLAVIKLVEQLHLTIVHPQNPSDNPGPNHYTHHAGDQFSKLQIQDTCNDIGTILVRSSDGLIHTLDYHADAGPGKLGWHYDNNTPTFILAYDTLDQLEPSEYVVVLKPAFRGPYNLLRVDWAGDIYNIPYQINARSTGFGWYYATGADNLNPSPQPGGIQTPTPWIVVYDDPANLDGSIMSKFSWDPTEEEGSMADLEDLRRQMAREMPELDNVMRLYMDEVDLPMQDRSAPPVQHFNRQRFIDQMNSGQHLVALSGHGLPWMCCDVIDNTLVDGLTNGPHLSIIFVSSCLTDYFKENGGSLSNHFVLSPRNGAVAYIGYTDLMEIPIGHFFQEQFFHGLAQSGVLGDAFDSRFLLVGSKNDSGSLRRAVMINGLTGDPALKVFRSAPLTLDAFFTHEAIRLAQYGGFSIPNRNALAPLEHMQWAKKQSNQGIISELIDRFFEQFGIQLNRGVDQAADFYANSVMRWINSGIYFGNSIQEPDQNSLDFNHHRTWAKNCLNYSGIRQETVRTELTERVRDACRSILQRQGRILEMIFTFESVLLGEIGGFANPADNSTDPNDYKTIPDLAQAREILINKYNAGLYALQNQSSGTDFLAENYFAEVCLRQDAYGIAFNSPLATSMDRNAYFTWAKSVPLWRLKDVLADRVRRLFVELYYPDEFPPQPEILLPDGLGNFLIGNTWSAETEVGQMVSGKIRVVNQGGGGFELASFQLSGQFNSQNTQINLPGGQIGFGQYADIEIDITIDQRGDYAGTLTFETSSPGPAALTVNLSVHVAGPDVDVIPSYHPDLGYVPIYATALERLLKCPSYKVFFWNQGDATAYCEVLPAFENENPAGQFISNGSYFSPYQLSPGQGDSFIVQYQPTIPGPATANIVIEYHPKGRLDLKKYVRVCLTGEGYIPIPKIEFTPSPLDFGTRAINRDYHLSPIVSNGGSGDLTITNLEIQMADQPDFASDFYIGSMPCVKYSPLPLVLHLGEYQILDIIFYPVRNGITYQGNLILTSNDPDRPQLSVPITGKTLGAYLGLSIDNQIDFGILPLNSPALSKDVGLSCSGTIPLTITGVELDPPCAVFSLSNNALAAPHVIQPGKKWTFQVIFTPSVRGTFTAKLRIHSDACSSPDRMLTVKGICK